MKQIFYIIGICLLTVACKTVKKTQSIQTAMTRDTTQKVVVKAVPAVDSAALVKGILDKVNASRINFSTFSAKVKVDYDGKEDSYQFSSNVKIWKDSVINIKIYTGITGVLFEAQITKDSVTLLTYKKKLVQYRSISYLQEVTEIPFDFKTLQDLIVGNPIFMSSNIVSYKTNESQLLVLVVGNIFKHLLTLDPSMNYVLTHSKLDDLNPERNRTCDITFDNYEPAGSFLFAKERKITVAEKSKLDVSLKFKEYAFDQPLQSTFSVPKNYKKQP